MTFLKNQIEGYEKKIYNWFFYNRYRIIGLLLISGLLYLISFLPYLNLYIEKELIFLAILVAGIIVFNLDEILVLRISILLFILAGILQILDFGELAEFIGDYIYGLLLYYVVKEIIKLKHPIV